MTNEQAKAIIRKEYLCVDRDCDIERNCGKCDLMMPSKEPILEAYKMAIKALEQEPKTGHWIYKQYGGYPECGDYHCSECDKIDNRIPAYCPHCGARMVESQERSDEE